MKNNENRDNNSRDLAIAYSISGFIYGIVGIFGSIGILVYYIINNKGTNNAINA